MATDQSNQDITGFSSLDSKLDEPEPTIQSDPADVISDTDKPLYSKKTSKKNRFANINSGSIKTAQIAAEINKAFGKKPTEVYMFFSEVLKPEKQRDLATSNITKAIAEDKVTFKAWTNKLKTILPSVIYGDTKFVEGQDVFTQNKNIIAILDKQRRIAVDQAIRSRVQNIIQNRIFLAAHADNVSILTDVAASTRRINVFLDTFVRKYMLKNLELKYKHIFVSQDILKHTKLMIETLSTKLESVKHNTSLSEVAKTSIFSEFKRNTRIKASNMVSDALIAPIKEPLNKFFSGLTESLVSQVGKQFNRYTGASPIEFDEDDTSTISSKSRRVSRKVRGDIGYRDRSFTDANMRRVDDKANQTELSKSIESALGLILDKKKNDEGLAVRTLSKTAKDKAVFDQITRRTIVDIIPSLLAKIHKQASITSKILSFSTRKSLSKEEMQSFDRAVITDEIKFDKVSEQFVDASSMGSQTIKGIFGDKEQRTSILQPIISSLHKGYTKHGGNTSDFRSALPSIVSFVTNISKHANVVKINHIKKYLNGEKLSDFEQNYLDAVFVDIPESGKKQLSKILTTTFFKDDTTVDTNVSENIGTQIRDLIKYRKQEVQRMGNFAQYGDLRDVDFVDSKGNIDHKKLRSIQSDVNIEDLKSNLDVPDEEKYDLKAAMAERIKRAQEFGSKTIRSYGLRRKGNEPPPIPPTRDEVQVSGPGEYIQGSKREFHIPFDKINEQVRSTIEKLIGKKNIKDNTDERVKAKKDDQTIFEKMNEKLEVIAQFNESALNALHSISFKMDDDGSPKRGLFSSAIIKGGKGAYKASKLYMKGLGKIYGGMFKLGGKALKGGAQIFPGMIGGLGKGLGKAGSFLKNIIPSLMKMYFAPYMFAGKMAWKAGKGAFKLGKKLFTEEKYHDVYRKDEVKPGQPLLKGNLIKEGIYKFASGKVVPDSFSISEPVLDGQGATLVSQDDIDHGLVDVHNKPLKRKGSLVTRTIKMAGKGVGLALKGTGKLVKLSIDINKFILGKIFSVIPGIAGLFTKKKGVELMTSTNVEDLITKHLITITELLKPISAQFGGIREGSYADYKRDRAEESGKKRQRFPGLKNKDQYGKADGKSLAAKAGLIGTIGSLFGLGGGEGEGDGSLLGDAAKLGAGAYALKKAKDIGGRLFGKKAAIEGAEAATKTVSKRAAKKAAAKAAAKSVAKKGIMKGALSRFGGSKGKILAAGLGALGLSMFSDDADAETEDTPDVETSTPDRSVKGTPGKAVAKDSIMTSFAKEMGISLAADKAIDIGKNLFGKKAAEGVARQGIMRTSMATLGRFGLMQGLRTAAVSGVTAIAGALSSPVVLGGLAVAGLGAGGYALWKWSSGNDRRRSITKLRNSAYKVPDDKIKILINFENDVANAIVSQGNSEFLIKKIKEYVEDFGLDPDDKRQFTFFKHWYATIFFPILKGSIDIIEQSFKVRFVDQEKLNDSQLNEYKKSLESSSIYQQFLQHKFDLSKKGFKAWQQENFFNDKDMRSSDDIQKELDERLDKSAQLIGDNGSVSKTKFEEMHEKDQERKDSVFDVYGDAGIMPEFNLPTKSPKSASIPPSTDPEKSLEEYQRSFGKGVNPVLNAKGKVNRTKTWEKVERPLIEQLIRLGWTKNQAIGIAANVHGESGGDHTAVGDGGQAYGLAQWHPKRQAAFARKFGKDIRQSSFEEQVAFIDYEMRSGAERKAGTELKKESTPGGAAASVTKYYERSSDIPGDSLKRSAFANSIARHYEKDDEKSILSKSDQEDLKDAQKAIVDEKMKDTPLTSKNVDPDLPAPKGSVGRTSAVQPSAGASSNSAWDAYGDAGITPESNLPAGSAAPSGGSGGGFLSSLNPFKSSKSSEAVSSAGGSDDSGPSDFDTEADLGDSVAKYESGSKGVASISGGKGDPGGASYGKYQLASKTGTLTRYLKSSGYGEQFAGLAPGTPAFNAKWTELAKSDPKFGESQHEFIKKTHFDPAIKEAEKFGFDVKNRGIQEAIWSGSIQHGGIKKIIAKTAAIPGFDKMNAEQQITAFYKARGDYASSAMRKNGASEAVIQNASYGRYSREVKDVLKLAGASANNVAKADPSIPSPVLNQQPIDNKPMSDIQSKDIKAGLPAASPVADVPKPVSVTPSPPSEGTKPVVSTPPSTPMTDEARIKNTAQAAATSGMADISSGKRAFKDKLYNEKRAAGISAEVAGREAAAEANAKFDTPAPSTQTAVDVASKFTQGNLSPLTSAPTKVAPTQQSTPTQQQTQSQPGSSEITVNDPESKTQTSLLEQQNQLLSQIANSLNGKPVSDKSGTVTGDNTDVVNKLDELIRAIAVTNAGAVGLNPTPVKEQPKRTVQQPASSAGIDVTRQKVK